MLSGTSIDMLCRYCGRPIFGNAVWGGMGPYHEECTKPPQHPQYYSSVPEWNIEVEELKKRIEKLEEALAMKEQQA